MTHGTLEAVGDLMVSTTLECDYQPCSRLQVNRKECGQETRNHMFHFALSQEEVKQHS